MDNGGWNIFYKTEDFAIGDDTEYFPVYDRKDYKQIAAFKTKELAIDYVTWRSK